MKSVPFRAVLLALLAIVAIGSLATTSKTSSTKNASVAKEACSDSGITLIVEFGLLKKASEVLCINNFSGSSWQLFEAAGLRVEGTAEYPNSFVCRIQDLPGKKIESCQGTPNPASGSWVYFVSSGTNPDKDWVRSPVGATGRSPECGDSEAWVFTDDSTVIPDIEPSAIDCR